MPTLAFEPTLSSSSVIMDHSFSDGQQSQSAKFTTVHQQKRKFDPNVSVLTQCSHITNRQRVISDQLRRHLNRSVSSLKSVDYSSILDENSTSEEEFEVSTSHQGNGRRQNCSRNEGELMPCTQTPKSSRKVIRKTKPPKLKFPHGENSRPIVELFDWIIKPLPDLKGVCVEGQKKGMTDFWHSSAITEVKKHKFVKTSSGAWYRLRGKINKLCTLENGFSKSVASAFAGGFPSNWKTIIQKFYSNLEQSITVCDEHSLVQGHSLKKIGEMKPPKFPINKKVLDNIADLDSILTPVGLIKRCNSANDFTVTRSGRLSLPPLARWQGQQYIFSTGTNTLQVGFHTAVAEKALLKETKDFMKGYKKYQTLHKSLSNNSPGNASVSASDQNLTSKSPTSSVPSNAKISVQKKTVSSISKKKTPSRPRACHVQLDKLSNKAIQNLMTPKKSVEQTVKSKPVKNGVAVDTNVKSGKHPVSLKSVKNNVKVTKNMSTLTECTGSKQNKYPSRKSLSSSRNQSIDEDVNGDLNKTADFSPSLADVLNSSMVLRSRREIPRLHFVLDKSCKDICESELQSSQQGGSPQRRSVSKSIKSNQATKVRNQTSGKKNGNGRQGLKRKRESSFSEDSGYCTKEQSAVTILQDSTPKTCQRHVRKRRRLSLQTEIECRNTWKGKEKELFERAMKKVDGNSPDFWCQVSEIVKSKTENECREFHTIYLEGKTKMTVNPVGRKKKLTRNPSGREKGDPVQGKRGTLKRKEGIREFLQEQNEDYEDNLFEGTPFISRKMPVPLITNIDFDKDDSEIFGTNHNFITPMTKNSTVGTPATMLRAQLASTRKTPINQTNLSVNDTPVSMTRQIADKYIHTFMHQRKRNSHDGDSSSKAQVDKTNMRDSDMLPLKALFSPSIVIYGKQRRKDEDEEEEEENNPYTYYWNEDDDE